MQKAKSPEWYKKTSKQKLTLNFINIYFLSLSFCFDALAQYTSYTDILLCKIRKGLLWGYL